nr:hypothetical protein [uncultured Rhodopila sp.]
MNASVASMASGLSAALRLARGRADGVVMIPGDRATIARSFWAIAFCLPSLMCRLMMSWVDTGIPSDALHQAGREVIVFVLGWLVFVEATYHLAPVLGRAPRWGRFIALWNWCNVIEGMLVVIGGLPGLFGAPEVIGEACELIAIGWALWLEWYATRLALGVGPLIATSLVLLDVFIGIVLPSIAVALSP